ncbi:hypothetical protein TNCV_2015531 [Trichonephila clavipes]|nr:hypothetical protein TNCV_2015531 [Trichonephila clavipes]
MYPLTKKPLIREVLSEWGVCDLQLIDMGVSQSVVRRAWWWFKDTGRVWWEYALYRSLMGICTAPGLAAPNSTFSSVKSRPGPKPTGTEPEIENRN